MERRVDAAVLIEELRKKSSLRNYPKDVAEFQKNSLKEEEDFGFYMPYLDQDMKFLNQNYYIDYHFSITGKFKVIKRIIKRLYCFHLEPLSDRQNDFNTEAVYALNQLRCFVIEQLKENKHLNNELVELKRKYDKQQEKISRLEERMQ